MSLKYYKRFGDVVVSREEMRAFLKFPYPERDVNGKIVYFTEQAHKDRCDVNKIIARYSRSGLIDHVSSIEASYGDLSGRDLKEMLDKVLDVKAQFMGLPSSIRARFGHDPVNLLEFMENPGNRPEAITLGLIRSDWSEATDGLGEHVKKGGNKVKEPEAVPPST